ncbi:Guanosine polyphosphate pyrophosphohydrolase/synthetase [Candidatus Koribacter versatilis Ellin345]|uniref:Guanosine polyphosphate pyrophosphohydrolase/synthetase n=1 Tax=Koribacter versatilis (strain Ellin345) TaxID=204669 RepID=Q1ISS0_KORVE|nr:HD domain-containing protein [Candidatus Koribacter versatilis]ABF40080.1 Guanosine polyphosphate pyrophosphohydrolase/synthetase [Candidatus Koribacter versatilis Ellin345]
MPELIQSAKQFALQQTERISQSRHPKQQTAENHLKAVAQNVASVTSDRNAIAAAWLHDIVGDTPVTLGMIERRFGADIARLVHELTPVSRPGDGDRAARFAKDKRHFAAISPTAKLVKLADMIDTCRDLRAADPAVARPFLLEVTELLPVLEDGDIRLAARLRKELQRAPKTLGDVEATPPPRLEPLAISLNALRVFERAFSAWDIADPLLLFHADADAAECRHEIEAAREEVAAVWQDGALRGYVTGSELKEGTCAGYVRAIAPDQLLDADGSLTDAIEILTRYDACFVTWDGEPRGAITRVDAHKPAVRMWLFGIITVIEMEFTERVRQQWPAGGWSTLVSAGRLEKARQLFAECTRRHEKCELLDCLQLGDKIQILISDPASLALIDIPTANAAKRITAQIESLRNKLAHSQDFIDQDWPQVVRLARRVEHMVQQF